MDRWTPTEKPSHTGLPLKSNPHREPKASTVTTPGSSDYVRLRGLREQGYYILKDD